MSYSAHVDEALCIGSRQCELFCPSVFEVHGGLAEVKATELHPEVYEAVLDAADACPVQAVVVSGRPAADRAEV